jgi:transcriptional regulator with XRE-family HTH domain
VVDTTGIGPHLRTLRKRRGISIGHVAHELGVSAGAVSQWELGVRNTTTNRLVAYCNTIGAVISIRLDDNPPEDQ